MNKTKPLISILVCNYEYESFIEESLLSAIAQTYPTIEIIVVDDGSTDDSLHIVQSIAHKNPDQPLQIIAKRKNEGLCKARNDALDAMHGDYFVFLDSDDVMPVDYVQKLYEVAVATRADVVYGDVERFGDETGKSHEPAYDPYKLLLENYVNISSLVKKDSIGLHRFDLKLNRKSHEDYDFWMGLSLMGLKFVKADGVYLKYRIQSQSRNNNTADLTGRTLTFVDMWQYMIEKYRTRFTVPEDIVFMQLKHQVERIGHELTQLNKTVQHDLNPEIERRGLHIEHQGRVAEDYKVRAEEFERSLDEVLASRDYRFGQWTMRKLRRAKRLLKRPN